MAITEHLADYMVDFAIPATVAGVPVRGIFDTSGPDSFGIVARDHPRLLVDAAEVPDAAVGDTVRIGNDSYTIADLQPDGTGMVVLGLKQ